MRLTLDEGITAKAELAGGKLEPWQADVHKVPTLVDPACLEHTTELPILIPNTSFAIPI
jgi:hypothetical protein